MADIAFEQIETSASNLASAINRMPSAEVERLRALLDNMTTESVPHTSTSETWGEHLVALVNQFNLNDVDQMLISDPEAWVREYRRAQTQKRNPGWGAY